MRADPLAVEQHVDGEHEDQDQRDRALDHDVVQASRVKETMSPEPAAHLSCSVSSAVSPWRDLDVDPLSSQPVLEVGELRVRVVDDLRDAVRNFDAWSPTGSASSAPSADEADDSTRYHAQHREAAREAARWSSATNGLSSSATSAATMKAAATGPAARSSA